MAFFSYKQFGLLCTCTQLLAFKTQSLLEALLSDDWTSSSSVFSVNPVSQTSIQLLHTANMVLLSELVPSFDLTSESTRGTECLFPFQIQI